MSACFTACTLILVQATSEVAGCGRMPWNSLASSTGEARASSLWGTTACPSSSRPAMDVVATAPAQHPEVQQYWKSRRQCW